MKRLRITEHMSEKEKRDAVEAALLMGFQEEAAEFPAAGPDGEIPVPKSGRERMALWKLEPKKAPDGYTGAKGKKDSLFELDFRKKKGLELMFSRGYFLKDENFDFLPDRLDVRIVLPEQADSFMVTAACNIAFRLGMETTAYDGPVTAQKGYRGNAFVLEDAERTELLFCEEGEAVQVILRGHGKELVDFSVFLCEQFPTAAGWRNWRDVLMDMTDDAVFRSADGQVAALDAAVRENASGRYTLYGAPEITEDQKKRFPDVEFFCHKAGKKVYEKVYELPWEVDTFEGILEEEIFPKLNRGDRVLVRGAVSEEKSVRDGMCERIRKKLEEQGAEAEETEILCAYKQGFSWISESVIPAVRREHPEKVVIFFRPFLPEGETEWIDENGATPSYHNLSADHPEKWYDLPIRYLQELYPIEDVLVRELGISREDVEFLPYDGEEDLTYLCRVYARGRICYENTYKAWYSERPYLDEYPQMGRVHPSTGYLQVFVNGEEKLCRRVQTDLEEIWEVYQKQVLPDCREYMEKKYGAGISARKQPFFQELLLDVTASEPDERVGCREDLISSLDALHEDLYFTGSDYFKNYGMTRAGEMLDAPGLILPAVHKKEGPPVFRAVLSEKLTEKPCLFRDREKIREQGERCGACMRLVRIGCSGRKPVMEIEVTGAEDSWVASYARLLEQGALLLSRELTQEQEILFVTESGASFRAEIHPPAEPEKSLDIADLDLHEREVIGYDGYMELIRELKKVRGIEVFRTARSYTGRELYAIRLKPEKKGYVSMTKRLTKYPSVVINARHHANEVSSTNAALILLKKLLTEEKYADLTEKLNLVLVPMENVDGTAIHYELQKEHPFWKLHVARFNAIGKEFYADHFQQDPLSGESMGLTRLYERYLPDVLIDNHGVPSHEWEQQFSGYTSPSYKGFWLPRSLLYGYFWYVTDGEYRENYHLNKTMEDRIADQIAEDEEMTSWNLSWSRQFEKYAHAWMPKLFPADYYKNMINYWIPFAYSPQHRYPSIRFPWITSVSYTSEVADETAQGEYLNLCARAHVAHDEATLQMLMEADVCSDCSCVCEGERISARYERLRPVIV